MRKTLLALASVTALAVSSAAGAAVTVTSSTNLNSPDPAAAGSVVVNGGITTINFGQNPVSTPTFTGSFNFNNPVAGLYTIVLSSSTPGVTFTNAAISGGTCTPATCTLGLFPDNTSLKLANALLCRFYRSQRMTWLGLMPLLLLAPACELTRDADLARASFRPHPGRLFYERRFHYPYDRFAPLAQSFLREAARD